MQNHISLAKSLENVGLLTAVPVKTNSGEEYVFDSGIYFYLTRRIKGKAVTAQSFYTDATTTKEESKVRFIGEILWAAVDFVKRCADAGKRNQFVK